MERLDEYVEWAGGRRVVAQALGVHVAKLHAWLGGLNEPSLLWTCRLALFLGVSLDELLGVRHTPSVEARRLDCEDTWGDWSDSLRDRGKSVTALIPRPGASYG